MILYTDIEGFCCDVLRARVADGGLLPGDVWERDVRTLTADELKPYTQVHLFCGIGASPLGLKWAGWPAELSVVTGGFPCQDISVAGKGAGIDGERSGLWKEMHRVIDIVRPRWVIAENVPALRTRGIDRVLGDMERIGYECWPLVVGADDVGAPHRRKRVWIVGSRVGDTRSATGERNARGLSEAQAGERRTRERDGHLPVGLEHAGAGVADAAGLGLRADGRTCGGAGHADERGEGVAHANSCGSGQDFVSPELRAVGPEQSPGRSWILGGSTQIRKVPRWPAGPGQPQHEWEAPRLVAYGNSRSGNGQREQRDEGDQQRDGHAGTEQELQGQSQCGVGDADHGLSRRLAGRWNRSALKALGNAQVPQVVELVARAILSYEMTASERSGG